MERGQLLLEQAGNLIDYLALHWYVDNSANDFATYMTLSELFEDRLSAYEGLIRAVTVERKIKRPIGIAVDEWNVWHLDQLHGAGEAAVIYNLEDALVVAMQRNAFIRHARTVRMANIAQIVNVLAPVFTAPQGLFLQTILLSLRAVQHPGRPAVLDIAWDGETFAAGEHSGVAPPGRDRHPERRPPPARAVRGQPLGDGRNRDPDQAGRGTLRGRGQRLRGQRAGHQDPQRLRPAGPGRYPPAQPERGGRHALPGLRAALVHGPGLPVE